MTPLATDGPGSGSGAGFGRDHAEKWQSDRVSRATLMVTKTTSLAGLTLASTRTAPPPLARSPPAQAPVVEHGHHTTHARPAQDMHLPVPDPPGGGTPLPPAQDMRKAETDRVIGLLSTTPEQTLIVNPLIRDRPDVRRNPAEYDSKATP